MLFSFFTYLLCVIFAIYDDQPIEHWWKGNSFKKREREITFFNVGMITYVVLFFLLILTGFLTQGVGVDSGDEEELVFVLCFINSRWFHDVFVFQPDKTHLSNQIQSLNFFEKFLYLFFFFILFPLFACALAFLYISDIDSIQLFYVGWGKGGVS